MKCTNAEALVSIAMPLTHAIALLLFLSLSAETVADDDDRYDSRLLSKTLAHTKIITTIIIIIVAFICTFYRSANERTESRQKIFSMHTNVQYAHIIYHEPHFKPRILLYKFRQSVRSSIIIIIDPGMDMLYSCATHCYFNIIMMIIIIMRKPLYECNIIWYTSIYAHAKVHICICIYAKRCTPSAWVVYWTSIIFIYHYYFYYYRILRNLPHTKDVVVTWCRYIDHIFFSARI